MATVLIKNGAVVSTDTSGAFTITTLPGDVINVSAAGFQTRSIHTNNLHDIDIILTEYIENLDEVVITGLATSFKRKNIARAATTISPGLLNGIAPAQTFDQSLNGKIPGAFINSNTGAPGGGVSVKLRGITSVYGNTQPLYIIDGVYIDNTATSGGLNFITKAALATNSITSNQDNQTNRIADIRPEDIQKIEVLKGASAAAIYGSRASGGVIIITTKRGGQGSTKINFSQSIGFLKAAKLLGVRTFTADRAAGLSSDSASSALLRQQFLDASAAGKIYDYEKEVFGNTGFTRNTVLSISGGSEKTQFYFSAMQKEEDGIVKNTGYKNSSFRLNLNHKINDKTTLSVSTNYISTSADRSLTGNDNTGVTLGIALSSTPSFAQLHPDEHGNYPDNPFTGSNPLQTVALMKNNESVNRFIASANFNALIQQSNKSTTRITAIGGMDFYNLFTDASFPAALQFQAISKGSLIQGDTKNLAANMMFAFINNYNPSSFISLTGSAGFTSETGNYKNAINAATHVIAGQNNLSQASTLSVAQLLSRFLNTGFFVQEEAYITDALLINAGFRLDRSTNNGDPEKFYLNPKASVSLDLIKIGWIKQKLMDGLNIRFAYGTSNNVPAYGSKYTSLVISNISGLPGSLIDIVRGSKNIKPERQVEFEGGIDVSMFKKRLSIEAMLYKKKIQGFLMLSTPPSSSGFLQQWINAGELQNRGVELGIHFSPFAQKNLIWSGAINFWLNRSVVSKFSGTPAPQGSFGYSLGGSFRIEQGKSATQIIGYNNNELAVMGDAEPTFQLTAFNEFLIMKRIGVYFFIHWKKGGDNINLTTLTNDFGGTTKDYDDITNPEGIANGLYRVKQNGKDSRLFIEDAGYLRLRELRFSYAIKKTPVKCIRSMNLSVSFNNFITITKYKSYDPEVSNFGTGFSTGVDLAPYPSAKRVALNISIEL